MSIIYEALKKVESSPENRAVKASNLASDTDSSLPRFSKKINLTFYALTVVCIISTAFIALSAYFSNQDTQSAAVKSYLGKKEIWKNKNKSFQPVAASIKETNTGTNKTGNISSAAGNLKPGSPVYGLQGIVYDENSPSAIINGRTLRKSETIDDFVVIDIAPTMVTLKNSKNDKELTLSF